MFLVLQQQRHARESLRTRETLVPLNVGMSLLVSAQVRPIGERPRALRTLERPLAGVRPQVALQEPRPRERLAALRTAARQRVSTDVHLEGPDRRVRLDAGGGGGSGRRAVAVVVDR